MKTPSDDKKESHRNHSTFDIQSSARSRVEALAADRRAANAQIEQQLEARAAALRADITARNVARQLEMTRNCEALVKFAKVEQAAATTKAAMAAAQIRTEAMRQSEATQQHAELQAAKLERRSNGTTSATTAATATSAATAATAATSTTATTATTSARTLRDKGKADHDRQLAAGNVRANAALLGGFIAARKIHQETRAALALMQGAVDAAEAAARDEIERNKSAFDVERARLAAQAEAQLTEVALPSDPVAAHAGGRFDVLVIREQIRIRQAVASLIDQLDRAAMQARWRHATADGIATNEIRGAHRQAVKDATAAVAAATAELDDIHRMLLDAAAAQGRSDRDEATRLAETERSPEHQAPA